MLSCQEREAGSEGTTERPVPSAMTQKRETLDRLPKSALTPPTTSLFTWAGYYNSRSSVHHCAAGNHTLGCFVEIFVCLLRGAAARLATRRALFSF